MRPPSPDDLLKRRYGNAKGKIIPMHHAFKTIHMARRARLSSIIMPFFFAGLVWLCLPLLLGIWGNIMEFWVAHIYQGQMAWSPQIILGQQLDVPYPALETHFPSVSAIKINLVICAVAFMLSFFTPSRFAPLVYLIRAALLIQGSASIDRFITDFFPYTLQTYIVDELTLCANMMFVLPLLLGGVYYIFDFSFWRKFGLTVLMLVYFMVAVPCQFILHASILHEWSMLFLPLLYMMFGVLIDVLAFICLYSYAMSWKSRKKAVHGRTYPTE